MRIWLANPRGFCAGVERAIDVVARAVVERAARCRLVVVVGSRHSSIATRLREIVARTGRGAVQVANAAELQQAWFDGVDEVGVTAGASTPARVSA